MSSAHRTSAQTPHEAHDLVMSVFGGMSKGERNRIKIRVSPRPSPRDG
ncbi:hypothetical protein ACFW95_10145 [Streptomyces sp. NPDC059474]